MAYGIFAGITDDDLTPNQGAFLWSNWNISTNLYNATPSRHFTIDTPNFPTTTAGTPINVDGQPCGSGPVFSTNVRNSGNAKNVGGGANFQAGPRHCVLGAVNYSDYAAARPEDPIADSNSLGNLFGGSIRDFAGQTLNKTPGDVIADSDLYNVIISAQGGVGGVNSGGSDADSGVAVYYMVAVGSLNGLLGKLQARGLGRGPTVNGLQIGVGWGDEQSASVWLSNGYGLLKNNALAFASQ